MEWSTLSWSESLVVVGALLAPFLIPVGLLICLFGTAMVIFSRVARPSRRALVLYWLSMAIAGIAVAVAYAFSYRSAFAWVGAVALAFLYVATYVGGVALVVAWLVGMRSDASPSDAQNLMSGRPSSHSPDL